MPSGQVVWIVNRYREVDGLFVFATEGPAREFHARYPESVLSEEVVMSDSAARQFLIDEGGPS